MEFKQDDSCSVQKSSCFLEIPFFKLSLTKGTLYYLISLYLYSTNLTIYIFITPIAGTDRIIPGIPKNPPPTVTANIVKNGLRPS